MGYDQKHEETLLRQRFYVKIIQVTQRFYPAVGGVETHVYNICKRLVERGHEVIVYTSDLLGDNPLTRLPDHAEKEVEGIEIRHFKAFKLFSNIDASVVMPSMIIALLKSEADVIHAHNYCYFPAHSTVLARGINGIPLVLTTHTSPQSMFPTLRKLYDNTVSKLIFLAVDHIVSLTKRDAEYLISIGAKREGISVIPNGVDMEVFSGRGDGVSFKERYHVDGKVVLFVGRLSREKGLRYLLDAMPDVLKGVPDALLVLVGEDFGILDKLKMQATQLGIHRKVRFIGPLFGSELLDAYGASDVFVLPSMVEGFSVSLLEAIAMGKPIVATNTGAAPDLISDGVNGFLIEPRNKGQITEAVIRLCQDEKLAKKMGKMNESIATKYSWNNTVQEIERVYEKVVTES